MSRLSERPEEEHGVRDVPIPLPVDDQVGSQRSSHRARWVRGAGAGAAAVAVVVLARWLGVLDGAASLVALGALSLAVPTSRQLSRRVLLAGCLLIGWLPLSWWVHWPVALPGRGTVLLAALAGALAAWIGASIDWRARARLVVPRVRLVDAVPFAGGAGTALVLAPWLRVSSPASALGMLAMGWDHSAHFAMAELTRLHGVVNATFGPAPMNEHWSYADYPQGYHSLAATVMDLVAPVRHDVGTDLVLYAHSMAIIAVVAVTVLLAGVTALPTLRSRPLVGAVLTLAIWSAINLGPGGRILTDGFPNFFLACVMVACLPLVIVPLARIASPLHVAAAGGAFVAVAHGWLLLALLAVPAVAAVVFPLRRSRWRGTRATWAVTAAVALATALASLQAYRILGGQQLGAILVVDGGVNPPGLMAVGVVLASCIGVLGALAVRRLARSTPLRSDTATRSLALVLVPVVGAAVSAAIAVLQIRTSGELGYYFWKFVMAFEIQAIVIVAVGCAAHLPSHPPVVAVYRRILRVIAAGVACTALVVMWGAPHPALAWLRPGPGSPAMAARMWLTKASAQPPATTELLLEAATVRPSAQWPHLVYLSFPSPANGLHPVSAAQWLYALTGTWTHEGNATAGAIGIAGQTPEETVAAAHHILEIDERAAVVVGPEFYAAVRDGVAAYGWADRVDTWGVSGTS